MKRCYINLETPLKAGEVRHGLLSKGKGSLVFDETLDEDWRSRRRKSWELRKFRYGTLRRMDDGELRMRIVIQPHMQSDLDIIEFGQELGEISDYIARYLAKRK